jgi:hypothetical protein
VQFVRTSNRSAPRSKPNCFGVLTIQFNFQPFRSSGTAIRLSSLPEMGWNGTEYPLRDERFIALFESSFIVLDWVDGVWLGMGREPFSGNLQKCISDVHRTERKVLPAVHYPWNWNGDCLIRVLRHANVGKTWTRRGPGLREVTESN